MKKSLGIFFLALVIILVSVAVLGNVSLNCFGTGITLFFATLSLLYLK